MYNTKHRTNITRRPGAVELLQRIGNNIARIREYCEFTQSELGALCGLDEGDIAEIEEGFINVTVERLETIMEALNCTAEDLLERRPNNAGSHE